MLPLSDYEHFGRRVRRCPVTYVFHGLEIISQDDDPVCPLAYFEGGVGDIANDRKKPGPRPLTGERIESAEGPNIGILDGILGIFPASQDPIGKVERRFPVREKQLLEPLSWDQA